MQANCAEALPQWHADTGGVIHHLALVFTGSTLGTLAGIYCIIEWLAVRRPLRPTARLQQVAAPVTILKPLCGAEAETYDCLRSFCDQQYPQFQIVFGVADSTDPAIEIVKRLQNEFAHLDLRLTIDRKQHGSNRKVGNLLNMMPFALHEVFVVADSDVRVRRDYLSRIVGPLMDEGVGIVTCTYHGIPRQGFWSCLGSLFINDWFMPSVHVAAAIGSSSFASGAAIGIRREVLAGIGGFKSIANQLADDYRLGELTRRAGLRTVLSDVVVDTYVCESSLRQIARHELRWLRTIRAVSPQGYRFLFVTFSLPIAALGSLIAQESVLTIGMCVVTAAARSLVHLKTRRPGSARASVFLLPLRDLLSLGLWAWSFVSRRVQWRKARFDIAGDGSARLVEGV